jgi:hypothetical protein
VRALFAVGLAITAAMVCVDTSSAAPPAVGCRAFANMPRPDVRAFARPRLAPWGQIRCATTTRVSVEICARRVTGKGLITLSDPVWCSRSRVRITSGTLVLVRARSHGCARGDRYVSYVSLDGLAWDQSAFVACGKG